MRPQLLVLCLLTAGCTAPRSEFGPAVGNNPDSLVGAKKGFSTRVVSSGEAYPAPTMPPEDNAFELIQYESEVGGLHAYVTKDPEDGEKHPAIVWITGGDNNSIDDVWSPRSRDNDQSASAFRKAGIVMMFPSQRGGNDNPGQREGFFGEVDDILAATEHLASLPYVDSDQIYLGGHSTGGTMAMLVGASSNRYKAIFSLGPVAAVSQYGGQFVYCDPNDENEIGLRSPINWMHCVKSPMLVIEGEEGNWDGAISVMNDENTNTNIQFHRITGHDHFSIIGPVTEILAKQVAQGNLNINTQTFKDLR